MPTFMIFQKGQKIDTVTGAVPAKLTVRDPFIALFWVVS
jgi:hypothetical protein